MTSRNFRGMDSSRASVLMRMGPCWYRLPKANTAFKPYCVRFDMVLIRSLLAYCKWSGPASPPGNSAHRDLCRGGEPEPVADPRFGYQVDGLIGFRFDFLPKL